MTDINTGQLGAQRIDELVSWPATITRAFAIDDAGVRPGKITCDTCGRDATGRMVDAYVSVFGEPTEVNDAHGHYIEEIDRAAYNKRLSDISRSAAGLRDVGVFYNHAKTLYDTPSERGSMPLGHPSVIRADGRGLLTGTHYGTGELAEQVLHGLRDGDISGHSFTGRIVRSDPNRVPRVHRGGELPKVRRLELGLTEYGPTPLPFYVGAQTVAVRAQTHQDDESDLVPELAVTATTQADIARRIRLARATGRLR